MPLSSVRQPGEELGTTAMELLLQEIDDRSGHRHRHVVFEPELVVRTSSAARAKPAVAGRAATARPDR